MSSPKTHTPCTIRWRRLPSHANREGWLGIPYDKDGNRDAITRYYVTPVERDGLALWTQHCDLLIDPREATKGTEQPPSLRVDYDALGRGCHALYLPAGATPSKRATRRWPVGGWP